MDELAKLTEQMSLDKKLRRRNKGADADMDGDAAAPKITIKSKPI